MDIFQCFNMSKIILILQILINRSLVLQKVWIQVEVILEENEFLKKIINQKLNNKKTYKNYTFLILL